MDDVCKLIAEKTTYDSLGNPTKAETERQVFCQVFGITRTEFYAAAMTDLDPELTIVLSDFRDYRNERLVEYNGARYSVIRTYRNAGGASSSLPLNAIELIVEHKEPAEIVTSEMAPLRSGEIIAGSTLIPGSAAS